MPIPPVRLDWRFGPRVCRLTLHTDHQTFHVSKINSNFHRFRRLAIPHHGTLNTHVSTLDDALLSVVILDYVRLWLGVYSRPLGPRPSPRPRAKKLFITADGIQQTQVP